MSSGVKIDEKKRKKDESGCGMWLKVKKWEGPTDPTPLPWRINRSHPAKVGLSRGYAGTVRSRRFTTPVKEGATDLADDRVHDGHGGDLKT